MPDHGQERNFDKEIQDIDLYQVAEKIVNLVDDAIGRSLPNELIQELSMDSAKILAVSLKEHLYIEETGYDLFDEFD